MFIDDYLHRASVNEAVAFLIHLLCKMMREKWCFADMERNLHSVECCPIDYDRVQYTNQHTHVHLVLRTNKLRFVYHTHHNTKRQWYTHFASIKNEPMRKLFLRVYQLYFDVVPELIHIVLLIELAHFSMKGMNAVIADAIRNTITIEKK